MLTQTTKKMESVTMSLVLWGFRARRTSELMRRAVPPMHTALAMASPRTSGRSNPWLYSLHGRC